MQTVLEMFDEGERGLIKDSGGIEKLRSIYESKKKYVNTSEFNFHMKSLFTLIKSLNPQNINFLDDKSQKKIEKLEFNPTISKPNLIVTDEMARSYSIWYLPLIYVPTKNSAKELVPEFVVMKGERKSMYDIDKEFKRSLYTYEFLSDSLLKKMSRKMLKRMKEIQLVTHVKKEYMPKHLSHIKDSKHYLNTKNIFVISEKELPQRMKMNIPIGIPFEDKVDLNLEKLAEKTKNLLE